MTKEKRYKWRREGYKEDTKGLLMVNTGDGKGKTTCALGLMMRAAGRGMNCCMIQFMKSKTDRYVQKQRWRMGTPPQTDHLEQKDQTMPRFMNRLRSLGTLTAGCLVTLAATFGTAPASAQTVPTVTIAATDASAAERNRDPGSLRVTRTGATTASLTVRYAGSGTATIGSDFAGPTGSVIIAAGQTFATIAVTPIEDLYVEGNETVILTLTANAAYQLGAVKAATVTIADNDTQRPALIVIPNNDFYYTEYGAPRRELELAGIPVIVGAGRRQLSTPHPNSGQGSASGQVMPDIDLASARATNYSTIVFVGGWGASQYQYAFTGTYSNPAYNATPAIRTDANRLINEFLSQNKYVGGVCLGVSDLAWARVNGVSPIRGRRVTTAAFSSPTNNVGQLTYRWHMEQNGATAVFDGGSYGNPATYTDDVIVDGYIITAGNFDSAALFGRTLANRVLGR